MKLAVFIDFKIYDIRLLFSLWFLRRLEHAHKYTVCPTHYQTRHFFNNSNTNEDIATKFEQE